MTDLVIASYAEFLAGKATVAGVDGFPVETVEIHPLLKPHQRAIVQWAVLGGRRAVFAAFGTGKTIIQLETLRLTLTRAGGRALVVCPLGVQQEFAHDAAMLGLTLHRIRTTAEALALPDGAIAITNYEPVRDGKLDPNVFTAVSLDEAAILRSFGSKTYQTFLTLFADVPYRFVATATPSPNRFKELIHYSAFLGILDSGQALTRFFKRDSTQANNLTLLESQERNFWLWLATWSAWVQSPADLCACACHRTAVNGRAVVCECSCAEYVLPALDICEHEIAIDHRERTNIERNTGQAYLLADSAVSLPAAAAEKRATIPARVAKMLAIVDAYEAAGGLDQVIVYCHLNDEQRAIERALADRGTSFSTIDGSMPTEVVERRLAEWKAGETVALIGKPVMLGVGLNLQRANKMIFVGIDYRFHDTFQAVHRIQRFGQRRTCEVHFIFAESEREIRASLFAKWRQHEELTEEMSDLIREHGLSRASIVDGLTRSLGVGRVEVTGEGWRLVNNDCVPEVASMPDASVGLIVTSIPFCYDEQTEVLTRRGWVGFNQVKPLTDELATVASSGQLEYQRPSQVVWERYEGEMIHFTGRSFNLAVTPNHRMYVARRGSDEFDLVSADQIAAEHENVKRTVAGSGRLGNGWRTCVVPPLRGDGERPERITIPPLPGHIRTGHGVNLYWVETPDFMRLAGWYLAEGHADSFEIGRSGGRLSIAQCPAANAENYSEIEGLMLAIGLPPSLGTNQVSVWCRNLAYFMQTEFGHGSARKRIPRWFLELHPDLLDILRDTMMKGDGAKDGSSYASISPCLRDDFQEVCLKTGWRATLNGSKVVNTGSTQLFPEIRRVPERIPYSGMIGCATVPNGTLVVRRNGQPCVSGNSNHYEYTPAYEDLGFTMSNDHFWAQMDYLTPELLRVLLPGRIYACHVKDRILFGNVTGAGVPTSSPFHAEAIMHGIQHGFDYLGMVTVVTDVVRENNQTYRLGWSEQCKDATKMGVGSPEYILLFHKPQTDRGKGYADQPVAKTKSGYSRARWQTDAHGFWRSSGDRHLTTDEMAQMGPDKLAALFTAESLRTVYDYESHVQIGETLDGRGALPSTFMALAPGSHHDAVWHDVNRMRSLNGEQAARGLVQHICLARDSRVLTKERGYVAIQDVTVSDQVLTHKGRWQPVIAVQNTGTRRALTLRAQGVPGLTLTPEHKLWARTSDWVRERDGAERADPAWLEARNTLGGYVNLKLPPVEAVSVPDSDWWVIGRWLADGHWDARGSAHISCGHHERDDLIMALGDRAGGTHDCGTAVQIRVLDPDGALKLILRTCGHGAADKRLPPEAFALPMAHADALLTGYLSGDGHFREDRQRWMASSVSRDLLLGMAILAQRVHGAIASVYAGRPARESEIQGRTVQCNQDWIFSFDVPSDPRRGRPFVRDDGAWKKVRSVEDAGEVETWNLRVAEDESFTAEGCIVKNCPLQLDIVDRLIRRYSNEGDLVLDAFSGLGTVPVRALALGRRGVGVELNAGYFLDAVKYLEAEERKQEMPTLFDSLATAGEAA